MNNYLIVVVGATAVGKTDFCISLAKHFGTEIISADARQCYQGMFIGTAQPTLEQQQEIKHHFINCFPVTQPFSAGMFEKQGLELINTLFKKHQYIITTGGSGLYIKALCEGLDAMPSIEPALRNNLKEHYKSEGLEAIQKKLFDLDPKYYEQVDKKNPQRILRALEICLATGKPYTSARKKNVAKRPFQIIKIGLSLPREELYERINLRVDHMINNGLAEEAHALYPYQHYPALQTVGYQELFKFFERQYDLKEAIELIKQNTRHYAKKQLTWFNNQENTPWFNNNDLNAVLNYIDCTKLY